MKHDRIDVIVVGGGHAGCEAAAAAARCGARTVLITLKRGDIGVMSCNPAIGGLGKGHLVREIDALDGIMGVAADRAGIQFRLLNRTKGPAVQGPRVQADRKLYAASVQAQLARYSSLNILEGEVSDLLLDGGSVQGVRLADGTAVAAGSVVLATGTFLNGVIHVGSNQFPAGRVGDKASVPLSRRLYDLGLPMGRLKTGTPPRLRSDTINWARLEQQPGDECAVMCSFLHKAPFVEQVSCGITQTNSQTHDIIRKNLGQSAIYGGMIESAGPRYCPSIEDKVVRFADRNHHQVFLEPEGLDVDVVYPNGISTSLPIEVQEEYVRSIVGLEAAEILQPGYAIEYDFMDPRSLTQSMMLRDCEGLFFAGQINGTTGYEEAAAQGLMAGLNAVAWSRGEDCVTIGRDEAYIGVMIDDLTTQGVVEPYRMFTSRAEYRLSLRADNADQRLGELGRGIGCVSDVRWEAFEQKTRDLHEARSVLASTRLSSNVLAQSGWRLVPDGPIRTAREALGLPGSSVQTLRNLSKDVAALPAEALEQVAREALYDSYLERQKRDIEKLRRDRNVTLPGDLNYALINGLSSEVRVKLERVRPATLAQAGRIDGMTPAALTLILSYLKKASLTRAV